MTLTVQALADKLNGRTYMSEITPTEDQEAKAAGLVVVFGVSDDQNYFHGAIDADPYCYDRQTYEITRLGLLGKFDQLVERGDEEELARYFAMRHLPVHRLTATFTNNGWEFETDIPHAKFNIVEAGEHYGQGLVFDINHLAQGEQHTENPDHGGAL